MLSSPRHYLRVGVLTIAALVLPVVHSTCFAQAEREGRASSGSFRATASVAIDVEFDGGTAVDFLDAVRKAAGGRVNIVAMPHVEDVMIPPMRLRSVDVIAAVNLLAGESLQSPSRTVKLDVRTVAPAVGETAALIKVNADVREAGGYSGPERSNIWSVADLMSGGMTPDNITTAVGAALELIGTDAKKAQVRFHKETSLLLARAEVEQIQIIHEVIDQLRESSAQRQHNEMQPVRLEADQLRARLQDSQARMNAIEAEMNERLRIAESAKARAEALERHTAELEAVSARLREEVMQRESMIRDLQMELDAVRSQLKQAKGGG